jgi:ABC-2 type transport system ATP-binding protein
MRSRPPRGTIVHMVEVFELSKQVRCGVFVRSPRRTGLARVLSGLGATVRAEPDRGLWVTGMDACRIASAAAAYYIPIQELTPRRTSLEGAYRAAS